ncbi:MAG: hypothetical protein GY861_24715, partial [bacterium]|nr:hypothetical protein [bacterium]
MVNNIVDATTKVYNQVKQTFLAEENRQYIYTPRDLSKWLIGMLHYEIKSREELLEVWGYEGMRVFRDKLINNEHKSKFDRFLITELNKFKIGQLNFSDIIYTSFSAGYSPILTGNSLLQKMEKEEFIDALEKGKTVYERDNKDLYLYYFDEIIESIQIINDRIISRANSNLLLVGTYGIGRKRSIRLAAHIRNMEICVPNLTKDYGVKEFKKDIKQIFQYTGVEGKNTVFIIEEHHLIKNEFLEFINSLLCSGEIPGFLTNEELESYLSSLNDELKEQIEYRTLYDLFVGKIQKFLKIVIILDSDDKNFVATISSNPALVMKCSVINFNS